MSKTIFILGRQPIFGLAELKSLLPNTTINTICSDIVSIDEHIDPMIIQRLGGVIKIAQVISTAEDSDDPTVEKIVLNDIKNSLNIISGKKFNFGISCYNTDLKTNTISSLAMKLKKILKKELISARMILSKETQLSIAQVIHNKLTKENGLELLIIGARSGLIFAQTTAISDINAYSSRDYERPYRDPKNGMLPPKLAQIMINLLNPLRDATILDPFCGSGVILQESLLMDFSAIGTDINSKMVLYSEKNLNWLKEKFGINNKFKVYKADATENIWQDKFDFIVSEIY
ncbi:MAG TPA: DNA methyltransferase, partial [Candidatus Saccharimonadia bacterium]|nr:DNA methyltransferase [Candidatus Saccharimonadia bacterium]